MLIKSFVVSINETCGGTQQWICSKYTRSEILVTVKSLMAAE